MKKLNLPNRLTLLRLILIPFIMFFLIFPILPDTWSRIAGAALFIITAFTDFLDGFLARRLNMITDFGIFLDPLADKLLIFGAMLGIMVMNSSDAVFTRVFVWSFFVVIFRELAVTSLRLVVSGKANVVIPASFLGKLKTISQMICMVAVILEPVIIPDSKLIVSYCLIILMTLLTLLSGLSYFKAYWKHIDPNAELGETDEKSVSLPVNTDSKGNKSN